MKKIKVLISSNIVVNAKRIEDVSKAFKGVKIFFIKPEKRKEFKI
jgi:hypothetical protein